MEYLAYWGYASSVVTIITAILSPILGTLADTKGFKKPIFLLCVWVGIVGCIAMGKMSAWLPFLVLFVIAKVGFSGSLVFYDSISRARSSAFIWLMPSLSAPSTRPRQATNGTQLPM